MIKFATDITAQKQANAESDGKIKAISKSQAVIEFSLDGTILSVNDNFLATTGFEQSEVLGKHHRMFCDPAYAATDAYREFWRKLGEGSYDTGEYKRFAKGGREIWLNASYNPIFDAQGLAVQGRQVRHRRHRAQGAQCRIRGQGQRHEQGAGHDRIRHERPCARRQ
ncbi:PAS domain-containing protein [Massilia sp. H-1]|nr:PAS domain-containing protein [Massilia sp. H-1]